MPKGIANAYGSRDPLLARGMDATDKRVAIWKHFAGTSGEPVNESATGKFVPFYSPLIETWGSGFCRYESAEEPRKQVEASFEFVENRMETG